MTHGGQIEALASKDLGRPAAFTIAICTLNRPVLLKHCLDALAVAMKHRPHPVLVVDNGPSDETRSVATAFSDRLAIQVVVENKRGVSYARNRALAVAATSYVVYVDDDAQPAAGWIDAIEAGIEKYSPTVFGGPYVPYFLEPAPPWFRYGGFLSEARAEGVLHRSKTLSGANSGWRVEQVRRMGGFPTGLGILGSKLGLGEETWLQARLRREFPAERIVFLPDMRITHYASASKMTVAYQLRRKWVSGRVRSKVFGTGKPAMGLLLALRILGSIAIEVARAPLRDRSRRPYWQQHIVEKVGPRLAELAHALP